jgi:hypothetical protein
MSIEPVSLSNPDPGHHPVTAVVSHVVRLGRDQGYEEWLHGIIANAKDRKFNKTEYFLLEGALRAPSNKKYSRLINPRSSVDAGYR